MSDRDREEFNRDVMDRAIRRLNVLEYVILGAAALLALLGGALAAWLLSGVLEVSFRLLWIVASLLLFVVPGALVYARENLMARPRSGERRETTSGGEVRDGG